MPHALRTPLLLAAGLVATLAVAACAPTEEEAPSDADATASGDSCATADLPTYEDGQLTIATDKPAFPPWFVDNDPTNGKGFESAVAYAVAGELGFADGEVEWVTVPFNASYQPGSKEFDFDINQISITPKRAESVTFSRGYYTAAQAVITLQDSEFAEATNLDELTEARFGVQVGTTSLSAITDVIQPTTEPAVYDDTNAATNALQNGQVDAIVADLPTAFYITGAQLVEGGTIVGQFQPAEGETEQFGLLFEQGDPLVDCVDAALATLEQDGTLAQLEQRWLADVANAPELS